MTALLRSLFVLGLLGSAAASGQPAYTIEPLQPPPGASDVYVDAVNSAGAAVGAANVSGVQSVLWPAGSGTASDLAVLIGRATQRATAINTAGHIALTATADGATDRTAHFWDGTTLTDIGKIGAGAPGSGVSSYPKAVNDTGQVVGYAWDSPTNVGGYRAFSWQGGVLTDLGSADTCTQSEAWDVNSTGQVVGYAYGGCTGFNLGVVWPAAGSPAVSLDSILAAASLPPRASGIRFAFAINDAGAVFAQETVSGKGRCLIITPPPGVSVVELGWIGTDANLLTTCVPARLNNLGEAVATQVGGSDDLALLWSGGTLYDLNTLLDAPSAAAWDLESAVDIMDNGVIVGIGLFNGQEMAYRATPAPPGPGGSLEVSDSVGAVDDRSLPFGLVTIGVGTIGTVTVTNGTAGAADVAISEGLAAPFGIADPGDCTLNLPAGGSCTITITFDPATTVPASDSMTLDLGGTPAVVSVSGTGRTATTTLTDSVNPADDLTVPFGNTVLVGGTGTATVTVRNTDLAPVAVTLAEGLGGFFSFQDAAACDVTLDPDETCTLTLVFAPTAAGAASESFTVNAGGAAYTVNVSGAPGVPNADFQLALAASNRVVQPGASGSDLTTLTVTVSNDGPDGAASTVSLGLPAGLSVVGAAPGQGSFSAGSWAVGDLAANAQATLQLQVQAAAPAGGCLVIQSAVAAVAPAVDQAGGNNSAALVIGAPGCADVAITGSSIDDDLLILPSDGQPGFSIRHTLTVRNNGPSAATGVVLRRLSYEFSKGTALDERDFPLGDLAAGESVDVDIFVDEDLDAGFGDSSVQWSATVTAAEPDPAPDNNGAAGGYNIAGLGSGGSGGCFIATAAFGSYLDPQVVVLRRFRDQVLMRSAAGRAFVAWYYRVSPPLAGYIRDRAALRALARTALTPVVYAVKYPAPAGLLALGLVAALPLAVRRTARASPKPR